MDGYIRYVRNVASFVECDIEFIALEGKDIGKFPLEDSQDVD
jgi:hypothetical protein